MEANDLLRGRTSPRAPELVALIHEVNPSGRDLAESLLRARYSLKSALQSLLIRQFGDSLEVHPVDPDARTIGLHHRVLDRDACHAILDDLDEDARAWVRLRLDLHEPQEDAPARASRRTEEAKRPRRPSPPPDDSLAAGRRALEEYDFDAARSAFQDAFTSSNGAPPAASALLELLVDTLAAFPEALALAPDLSSEAARVPGIRERLALAAAHQGAIEDTLQWLEGVPPATSAETLATLARVYVSRGALDTAAELTARARDVDPSCGAVVLLEDEIRKKRAGDRAPLEAELERVFQLGDEAATEARARALLASHPDSSVAGRILRSIELRRREAEASAAMVRGEAAFASGDFVLAAQHFRQAEALGSPVAGERLAAALSADRERTRRLRWEAVADALRREVSATTLERFLALDPADRADLREALPIEILDWAETAGAKSALAYASVAQRPPSEFDRILPVLEPHARALAAIPRAAQLISEARAAREGSEADVARARLESATAAFRDRNPAEAVRVLESADVSRFPSALRAEANALLTCARAQLEGERQRSHFEELQATGRVYEALDWAARHERTDDPEASAWWRAQRARVGREVREAFKWELVEHPALGFVSELRAGVLDAGEVSFSLDEDGSRQLQATGYGRWLFLRERDVRSGRVLRVASLRVPEPFELPDVFVHRGAAVLSSTNGTMLELSIADGSVLRWIGRGELAQEGEVLETIIHLPGSRFLSTLLRIRDTSANVTRVHDLERGRIHRELREGYFLQPVVSPEGLCIFSKDVERSRLLSETGAVIATFPGEMETLCARPDDLGYAGILSPEDENLRLVLMDASGSATDESELLESWPEMPHCIASARESSCLFALSHRGDAQSTTLAAWELKDGALRSLYECEVPARSYLAQDAAGRHVVLVSAEADREDAVHLGTEPPSLSFPTGLLPEKRALPFLDRSPICEREPFDKAVFSEARAIRQMPSHDGRARAFEALLRNRGHDPEALIQIGRDFRVRKLDAEADRAWTLLEERFGKDPSVQLQLAADEGRRHAWEAVIARLLSRDDSAGSPEWSAHRLHLLGTAYFQLGRFEEARDAFARGSKINEDRCSLAVWGPWLDALEHPASDDVHNPVDVRRVLAAVREADRLLAMGRGEDAKAALDAADTWSIREPETRARHAAAILLEPCDSPTARFRRRLVLAGFLALVDDDPRFNRKRLPLGALAWGDGRIEEVTRRAREWLDADA